VVWIYTAPDGKIGIFINKLDLIIQKLIVKNKILFLCGYCNINLLHQSSNEREFSNLLLRYNLKHTVNVPTRITKYT
jgi:hypothetical protein